VGDGDGEDDTGKPLQLHWLNGQDKLAVDGQGDRTVKDDVLEALEGLSHAERLEVIDALVDLMDKDELAAFLKEIAVPTVGESMAAAAAAEAPDDWPEKGP
jgi:hypothetical protein